MLNAQYQLYIESVLNLAETLTVKYSPAAEAINYQVMADHGVASVDLEDPTSWKYYQNIGGNYHFSDQAQLLKSTGFSAMRVTSLDTLTEIDFTVENLVNHPQTKEGYLYNTRLYRELILKYPNHEALILGILYPCPVENAVSAKNGTILSYAPELIEENEYSLIERLQTWLYGYVHRWNNQQYAISDDLYVAGFMGQLALHLVPAILNLRLRACKTNEAHSFHIRQFLASHQGLDVYWETLTRSQALFLYRNLNYIERNPGKQETFDWLIENLLTVRNIPIHELTAKHDVSEMLSPTPAEIPHQLHPEIFFRRKPLNVLSLDSDSDVMSYDQVLRKLNQLAPGNELEHEERGEAMRMMLEDSKSNVVATKLLHSSVTDYTDAVRYPLSQILLNEWVAQSCDGLYNPFVIVPLPKSNTQLTIQAKDAFILLIYAQMQLIGVTLPTVPKVRVERTVRRPKPSYASCAAACETKYLDADIAAKIYALYPALTTVANPIQFYNQCKAIYTAAQHQYNWYSSVEHQHSRGALEIFTGQLYEYSFYDLESGKVAYSDWFEQHVIDIEDYAIEDWRNLSDSIILEVTGLAYAHEIPLWRIQKDMIELLKRLSSYSIEVIREANTSPITILPNPAIRIGDQRYVLEKTEYVDGAEVDLQDHAATATALLEYQSAEQVDIFDIHTEVTHVAQANVSLGVVDIQEAIGGDAIEIKNHTPLVLDVIAFDTFTQQMTPAELDELRLYAS